MFDNEYSQKTPQWYINDPNFRAREIAAVQSFSPNAKFGFLPDSRMYWLIPVSPVINNNKQRWMIKIIYDQNHPERKIGGSIRVYIINPQYTEIMEMIKEATISPKVIPHCIMDSEGLLIDIFWERNQTQYQIVKSATSAICGAFRWISVFNLGLKDQETWTLFSGVSGERL